MHTREAVPAIARLGVDDIRRKLGYVAEFLPRENSPRHGFTNHWPVQS